MGFPYEFCWKKEKAARMGRLVISTNTIIAYCKGNCAMVGKFIFGMF
jgi:hypothetical protein